MRSSCRAGCNGTVVGCSEWDCPFHTFAISHFLGSIPEYSSTEPRKLRLRKGSSLLLSENVGPLSVHTPFPARGTSAYASEVALRPLLCAVWTFLSSAKGE